MIKVLRKRLRKVNGCPVRGRARQELQLVKQKETKRAIPN